MRRKRPTLIAISTVIALTLTISPTPANAQSAAQPNQVANLTVRQSDGYATLAWQHVEGATDYQIERTAVDANGNPTGAPTIVGIWRPNRQVNQESPTFADAGFNPGDRFQWRVRARAGTTEQPYSEPVVATTTAPWGNPDTPGEQLRTQWETTRGAQYTNDVNEYAYTEAIDALSDRVRVVELGRTLQNRPVNMMVFGNPPAATPEAVAATAPVAINCNVHGNEPGDREACLIMARQLAFSTDPRIIDLLSRTNVLIIPTINGDGRANNTRGNAAGQDLNRDYSLIRQPETTAYIKMVRDYRPVAGYDGHEYGNARAGDLPMLPPRHQNVPQSIFDQSQDMIEGHMYTKGAEDGWWACPYGCEGGSTVGNSEETILRNTLGLKNVANSLLELRSSGGQTRPDEGNTANNRRRKTYSALWTFHQFLDYQRANKAEILGSRAEAIEGQAANTGRIVFRGSRPIPAYPAPHPGDSPPGLDAPRADLILDNAPCAYRLTEEQYNGTRTDGPGGVGATVAQRIAAHGWKVVKTTDGYYVPLNQPERGLIPLLLDTKGVEKLVDGERIYPNLTGRRNGPLTVSGFTCADDATINGPVTIRAGAAFVATGTTISGPVTANGASGVLLADSTVNGPVQIANSTNAVSLIDVAVSGPVNLTGTGADVPLLAGNTIRGPLNCTANSTAPTNLGVSNTVHGPRNAQCAAL